MKIKFKRFICSWLGHRSITVFSYTHKWEHDSYAQCVTVHRCERCGDENKETWQDHV